MYSWCYLWTISTIGNYFSMQWLHHIQVMCSKANRSPNFLHCNLIVRLDYWYNIQLGFLLWMLNIWYRKKPTTCCNIGSFWLYIAMYSSSMTDMLNFLEWLTLQEKMYHSHKIVYQLTSSRYVWWSRCYLIVKITFLSFYADSNAGWLHT